MNNKKLGVIECIYYHHVNENLIRYSDSNRRVNYSTIRQVLGLMKVPKWMRIIIINEMIEFGYLIRHKKRELEIVDREYDKNRFLDDEDEQIDLQKV